MITYPGSRGFANSTTPILLSPRTLKISLFLLIFNLGTFENKASRKNTSPISEVVITFSSFNLTYSLEGSLDLILKDIPSKSGYLFL